MSNKFKSGDIVVPKSACQEFKDDHKGIDTFELKEWSGDYWTAEGLRPPWCLTEDSIELASKLHKILK